jgi:hypothetical protein
MKDPELQINGKTSRIRRYGPEKLAEHAVRCELFSSNFPANREEYREMQALVDGSLAETPIWTGVPGENWNLSEIETG